MTNTQTSARFDFSQRDLPRSVLAVTGPVAGLLYIVILPVVGLVSIVLLSLYLLKEVIWAAWRKVVHASPVA